MFLIRLFITALRSLDSNFLRSVLATLGVVIGVMAVISAMSILEGARKDILDKFQTLGSNVLYIMPAEKKLAGRIVGLAETLRLSDVTADGRWIVSVYGDNLTDEDYFTNALESGVPTPGVDPVVPQFFLGAPRTWGVQVRYRTQ